MTKPWKGFLSWARKDLVCEVCDLRDAGLEPEGEADPEGIDDERESMEMFEIVDVVSTELEEMEWLMKGMKGMKTEDFVIWVDENATL